MTHQGWETKFNALFSELDHPWSLEIISDIVQENGWLKMQRKGMATFDCRTATCSNRWTSVNGGAIFYYRLSGPNNGRHGDVKLFLGGQKCKKCNDVFEVAKWKDSDIERVITKLLNKGKEKFYDPNDVPASKPDNTYNHADMSAPHQTHLCEFCQRGVCQYGEENDMDSIASQLENLDFDDYSDEDYDYISDSD